MNPITAVVKGTTKAAKSAASRATSTIPKPSEAVYNLGLGIGPLLRNIADEMKRDSKSSESKEEKKNNQSLVGKKELASLSTQLSSMVSVLKEIRNIGMMQLRSDQQRLLESRRQSFFDKETAQESALRSNSPLSAFGSAKGSQSAGSTLKEMAGLFGGLPGLLKLAVGAGTGYAVWNYVFNDKTRDLVKEKANEILFGKQGEERDGGVVGALGNLLKEAFAASPLLTIAGGLLAAKVTGVLGAGKFAYNVGSTVGKLGTAGVPTTIAPPVSATRVAPAPPTPAPQQPIIKAMTPAEKQLRAMQAEEAAKAAPEAPPKPNPAATNTSEVLSKIGKTVNFIGRWAGRSLLGAGGVASGIQASEDFKQGKETTGTLNAVSSATGALALGATFVPGLQPLAGALAGISAITGAAGFASSFLEKGKTVDAPTPAATQPKPLAGTNDDFFEKYKEMIGYTESRGNYGATNDLGYLGKYQFGAAALETLGYLKQGASKKVKSTESQRPVVDDPSNWTNGWTKESFLMNKEAQDQAFAKMTEMNLRILTDAGVITTESTAQEIAGYLAGAHLGGAGGVIKHHKSGGAYNPSDVNGTSINRYIQYGKNAFAGAGQTYELFSNALKAAKAGTVPNPGVTPDGIQGQDSRSADIISELTKAMGDWSRSASQGFGVFNVDQSSRTNVVGRGGGDNMNSLNLSDGLIRGATSAIGLAP